jgi:hypothetical protein
MPEVLETPLRKLTSFSTDELDKVLPDSPEVGICQRYYKCNGEKLTELMTMCIGLKSVVDDRYLGDASLEPYASMKFRKKVTPTQKHMVEEIKRRSLCNNDEDNPTPLCNYWTKERLQAWLSQNPVVVPEDVVFLRDEEHKLFESLNNARSENGSSGEPKSGAWTTNEPYLRMYHCMFHDDVKPALLRLNNTLGRPELDARNSSARPETFFEAVCRIYNDEDIMMETEALPDLHYSFAYPIVLLFEDMPGELNPEECKKRFADCRAKLIKIISKWELSGNGFGQRTLDEDEFGHMGEDNLEAGDNRGNFLDSMTKEHILYFWHLADKNELLKNVLNVIADTSAADTDNYQSTTAKSAVAITAARRRTSEARLSSDFRLCMGQAMATMSQTALMQELREAELQSMRYQELCITTDNPRLRTLYSSYTEKEEERITELQSAVDRLKRRKVAANPLTVIDSSSSDDENEL